jgi:PLP dependent protein
MVDILMKHTSINNLHEIAKEVEILNKDTNIIAVSKTFEIDKILPLIQSGHQHFGENKVQESVNKWPQIISEFKNIKLHMIGKLQTNKVKQAVNLFDYIHSIDTFKLAKKIAVEQKKINKNIKLFIQINVNNEDQKAGIMINELKDFHESLINDLKLNVIGLMCIPSIESDTKEVFGSMKKLSNKIGTRELSMGMSADYLDAAKNGSTFIRIGSKIFGKRN